MFSTLVKLLVGISGSLGRKETHFSTKNEFWRNAVRYFRNGECYSFQTFAFVFITLENLLVGISGSLEMKEGHFHSKNMF